MRGFNTGATEYYMPLAETVRMDSLPARISALLFAAVECDAGEGTKLEFHDITMDLAAHRVQRNGRLIHLL